MKAGAVFIYRKVHQGHTKDILE